MTPRGWGSSAETQPLGEGGGDLGGCLGLVSPPPQVPEPNPAAVGRGGA